jgi:hypothetical protein
MINIIGAIFSVVVVIMFASVIGINIMSVIGNIKQRKEARAELLDIIQQAGGKNIYVQEQRPLGIKRTALFDVSYDDINGKHQTHRVSRETNIWGMSLRSDFHWDRPLQTSELPVQEVSSESKEQIISEMDAEIKRLQEELARTKKEA